jgi:hypothetical protein
MPTTTKLQDFLGRWLTNGTPGTTNATDHAGRAVVASNKDFLGRSLTFDNPSAWAATTAQSLGTYRRLTGGGIVKATTAGTTAGTEPAAIASVGGTRTDGTVVWTRIR